MNFKSVKCPKSGKEKNRKSGIRTFENSRTLDGILEAFQKALIWLGGIRFEIGALLV